MSATTPAFAALSRPREFRSLALGAAVRGGEAGHQPLPIQRGSASQGGDRWGGVAPADDAQPDIAPPPPTHEELAAAVQARQRAEQALGTAQAELVRLRAQIEAERARTRELATAFEHGLSQTREELRAGYARLVMEGARRLVGALQHHEAVFLARLQEVADQLVLEPEVVLKVAPRNKAVAEAAVFGRGGWLVEVDPDMDGGCLAQCRNAIVDARMATAFAGLERALEAWVQDDGQVAAER